MMSDTDATTVTCASNETISEDNNDSSNFPPLPPLHTTLSQNDDTNSSYDLLPLNSQANSINQRLLKEGYHKPDLENPKQIWDQKWNENFAAFQEFIFSSTCCSTRNQIGNGTTNTTNGHANAHGTESNALSMETLRTNDLNLFRWVQQQRSYASSWEAGIRSPMTSARMDQLIAMNFFDTFATKWEEAWSRHYNELRQHYSYLHYNHNPVDGDGESDAAAAEAVENSLSDELKGWVRRQRSEYAKFECSEKTSMTRSRIESLEAIPLFQWQPAHISRNDNTNGNDNDNDVSDPKFQEKIKEIKAFKQKHGHLMVPKIYPENKPLGRWVARQRAQYRSMQASTNPDESFGMLTEGRIQVLEDLGFQWVSTSKFAPGVTWDKRFGELKAYKSKYGHFNVPKNFKGSGLLATWVRNQRCFYMAKKRGKHSPMTNERIEQLKSIGFEWKLRGSGEKIIGSEK